MIDIVFYFPGLARLSHNFASAVVTGELMVIKFVSAEQRRLTSTYDRRCQWETAAVPTLVKFCVR